MSVISNAASNRMLDSIFCNHPTYIALHRDDPSVLGDGGTEVSGSDYLRQVAIFSGAGSRSTGNTNLAQFVGMPESRVTHLAIWDAITAGNMLAYKALTTPIDVPEGYIFVVPANTVVVTFS